jgi:hypothetical protein
MYLVGARSPNMLLVNTAPAMADTGGHLQITPKVMPPFTMAVELVTMVRHFMFYADKERASSRGKTFSAGLEHPDSAIVI